MYGELIKRKEFDDFAYGLNVRTQRSFGEETE
jgi:hypothetical protein